MARNRYDTRVERAIKEAQYIADNKCTVRDAAAHFMMSKSTIHKDMQFLQRQSLSVDLVNKVQELFEEHKQMRSILGGEANKVNSALRRKLRDKAHEANTTESDIYKYTLSDSRGSRRVIVSRYRTYKTFRFILSNIDDYSDPISKYKLYGVKNISNAPFGYKLEIPSDLCITKDEADKFGRTEDTREVVLMSPIPYIRVCGKFKKGPKELKYLSLSNWHDYLISHGYRYVGGTSGYIKETQRR